MIYIFEIYRRIYNLFFFIKSNKQERNLIAECINLEFNTTPKNQLWKTLELFKEVIKKNPNKGNFVECGVWKGGYLVFFQKLIEIHDLENCKIYGFDTFEGMSMPTKEDKTRYDVPLLDRYNSLKINDAINNWNYTEIDKVKENYYQNTKTNKNLILVKGKVENTLLNKQNVPEEILILRLDTCLYTGTKIELEVLFPKVLKGGIILVENYFTYKGVKKATDEFFNTQRFKIKYSEINAGAVIYK